VKTSNLTFNILPIKLSLLKFSTYCEYINITGTGFEILIAIVINVVIFWHIALAFRRSVLHPSSGSKFSRARSQRVAGEAGSDAFFRNVGSHTNYTELYPRR
jgi:hypothetical protein